MIVEERCYTLKPGTLRIYYEDYDPRGLEIQTGILGNLIGYFHTEIGELNQVVHSGATTRLPSASVGARCLPPIRSGRTISSSRPTSS
jgi:hypothetical protein